MPALTQADLAFWERNGYVILRNAVPQANVDAVVDAIWDFMEMDRHDPPPGISRRKVPMAWSS